MSDGPVSLSFEAGAGGLSLGRVYFKWANVH